LRIGRYRTPIITDTIIAPECVAAYEHTSSLLDELGHEVIDIDPPFGPEEVWAFETVWAAGVAAAPIPPEGEQLLQPLTAWLREWGQSFSAGDLFNAVAHMRKIARQTVASTQHLDAVLTPTLAQPPAPVGGLRNDADPAADFAAQKAFTPFTSPFNVSGQPAIQLPLFWTVQGLPIGTQLVGRPGDEITLIMLGSQLQDANPNPDRHAVGG
jgi:amidase